MTWREYKFNHGPNGGATWIGYLIHLLNSKRQRLMCRWRGHRYVSDIEFNGEWCEEWFYCERCGENHHHIHY